MSAKIKSLSDLHSVNAYLNRIGAEPRSLRTAVVKEHKGAYWTDIAHIKFAKNGDVDAPEDFMPTEGEQLQIKVDFASAVWPEQRAIPRLMNLPDEMKGYTEEDLFLFRDEAGLIIMVQQRIDKKDGGKVYVPWTYWDDDMWRKMEPEGRLPLWGIEQLKDHSTVFIHEGAKAARHVRWMVAGETPEAREALKNHPWGEELLSAAHVGWIGGALSPARTDWRVLARAGIKRAYIVSDNDAPGVAAVPAIAYQLRMPTFQVQFTQDWPVSFDLADTFPKHMFKQVEGQRHYVGPSFRSCLHPATWATDLIPNPKGKPTAVLREDFKTQWAYIEEADLFVCIDMPNIIRTEPVLNKMLSAFSHVSETTRLLVRTYRGRAPRLCYRPDIVGRIVTDKDTSAINLHVPTLVKSVAGNAEPWREFLRYMFPIEAERLEVERFCATLIARPDTRMEYGLLLVSERQGIGKTTLGEKILSPLVGEHNTGFPTESQVVDSNFNSWLANKRLVVIGEIYSGHSWKAYNTLKSCITDKIIEVNQKYMRPYKVENWAHIVASSNSRRALKMEQDDRRWFYPKITEVAWPRVKFAELNNWLQSGGLSIIKHWAENYGQYVTAGERAPMTEMKKEMVEGSRSEAQRIVSDFCEATIQDRKSFVVGMKSLSAWVRIQVQGNVHDTDYELRKVALEKGFVVYDKRIKVGVSMQYVIMSPVFYDENRAVIDGENTETISRILREGMKNPADLSPEMM